ncbi:MAG: outer membrane protein assembly factor BamD [Candidatus Eisenbacteria bacterium]
MRDPRRVLVSAVLLMSLVGCGAAVVPQIHNDSERMSVARRMYDKGDYAIAAEILTPYISSAAGSADVDEAIYLLGLSHLKAKDWAGAQADFQRLQRDYPESDSAQSGAFRLGEAYFGQSRGPDFDQEHTLKALEQWMSYRRDFPEHWLASQAQARIAECRARLATKLYRTGDLYVKLKEYEPARTYFKNIMTQYSDTPIYGDAILGMAVADARLGHRDTALVILKSLEEEFAGRPLAERAAKTRTMIMGWPAVVRAPKRRAEPNEPPPPAAQPGAGAGINP